MVRKSFMANCKTTTRYVSLIFMLLMCSSVLLAESARNSEVTICIAPLNNNTGQEQYDDLAKNFADMLIAAVSGRENIKVVERSRLRAVLREHELSLLGLTEPQNAIKAGKMLQADRILVGGIIKPEKELILNVHAYEIATARLVASKQVEAKPDDIYQGAISLVNRIYEDLQLQLDPIDPNNIDKNPNASLHFLKGLGFFYADDCDRAIIHFMRTVDYDPVHTKARLWTAKAFIRTGEFEHARIELKKIIDDFPDSSEVKSAKSLFEKCESQCDDPAAGDSDKK